MANSWALLIDIAGYGYLEGDVADGAIKDVEINHKYLYEDKGVPP